MNFLKNLRKRTLLVRTAMQLNAAFLVSSLGDRLWMFAIGIFLHQLGGITWIAIHQLIDSVSKLLLMPVIGSLLDKTNRNSGMQMVLLVNNVTIAFSAFLFLWCFWLGESSNKAILIVAILFGSVSRVASEAQKTAFTKICMFLKMIFYCAIALVLIMTVVLSSWYEVIRCAITAQNATMTIIDQVASFATPIIAAVIIGWNIFSWLLEAVMLKHIYATTPDLALRESDATKVDEGCGCVCESSPYAAYFRQKCFRPAFGLALLYMTVLGFDNLALSYGAEQGMTAGQLGAFRSAGSLLGVLGAFSYTGLERNLGLINTGLIGLLLQNLSIGLCSTSQFLAGSPFYPGQYFSQLTFSSWWGTVQEGVLGTGLNTTMEANLTLATEISPGWQSLSPSILVFFLGITFARYGLWIADPSITQIMQETIVETERYAVFGVQTSFCEFFSILKDIMVIGLPDPSIFGVLIFISAVFILIGFVFYLSYFISESCFPTPICTEVELEKYSGHEETGKLLYQDVVDSTNA